MENEVVSRVRDAAYTLVGFGVLATQRLQVQRRELTKDVVDRLGGPKELKRRVRKAQGAIDPVLDVVERRLPLPSRLLVKGVRRAARSVEEAVLG